MWQIGHSAGPNLSSDPDDSHIVHSARAKSSLLIAGSSEEKKNVPSKELAADVDETAACLVAPYVYIFAVVIQGLKIVYKCKAL